MSNLRIKNKKLKREIEKLKAQSIDLTNRNLFYSSRAFPTTLRAAISFSGQDFYRMTTDGYFDAGDYVQRSLIDEMRDELIKHMTVRSHHDFDSNRIVIRGELNVMDGVKED